MSSSNSARLPSSPPMWWMKNLRLREVKQLTLDLRTQEVHEQMFKPTLMTPKPMPSPFLYGSLESCMAQTGIEEDLSSQLPPNSFVTLRKLLGFSMPELPNL